MGLQNDVTLECAYEHTHTHTRSHNKIYIATEILTHLHYSIYSRLSLYKLLLLLILTVFGSRSNGPTSNQDAKHPNRFRWVFHLTSSLSLTLQALFVRYFLFFRSNWNFSTQIILVCDLWLLWIHAIGTHIFPNIDAAHRVVHSFCISNVVYVSECVSLKTQ